MRICRGCRARAKPSRNSEVAARRTAAHGSVEPYSPATIPPVPSRMEGLAMLRWSLRLLTGIVTIALIAVITGPWLLYAIGLAKIDGRPNHASHATVAPEDVEALARTLRISQPTTIDRLSPYSYVWTGGRGQGVRVAWPIARSHNADHLADRFSVWWHLSGAALTIWLTRNWTTNELIAKAIELEKACRGSRLVQRDFVAGAC
jgi:hypothetical protein